MSRTLGRRGGRYELVAAAALAVIAPWPTVSAQGGGQAMTPLELRACRYADGRSAADLAALGSAFNAWMEQSGAPAYDAYVLQPLARSAEVDFELAWVGVWPSGAAMGASLAHYFTAGAELEPVLDSVLRCDRNTHYAALTLRPTAEAGGFGPVEVSSCTLRVGAGIDAALPAVQEWVEYFGRLGSAAAHWILFPSYGESSAASYSFKWAIGYPSYEAFGIDYDEFYNGGGVDRFAELLDPFIRCDSPRLYSVQAIRAGNQASRGLGRAGAP